MYFSNSELVGLPGLPKTVSAIIRKAKRENWQSRPREGRGGGLEYHVSSLPAETREALKLKELNEVLSGEQAPEASKAGKTEGAKIRLKAEAAEISAERKRLEGAIKAESLEGKAKDRMEAKLEIIKAWELFKSGSSESTTAAQHRFCLLYGDGAIKVSALTKELIPSFSQGSLSRWIRSLKKEGLASLSGSYGNRSGSGVFDTEPALRTFALSLLAQAPHMSAAQMRRAIKASLSEIGIDKVPSERTVGRFLNAWKEENASVFEMMNAPDQWKNNFMLGVGSYSESVKGYLDLWEMDSTPSDIMLSDGRYTIVGVIDVWSRSLKLLVSKTSTAYAVSALIRRALLDWGVPVTIKTDNGADYSSKHVTRVIGSLGIEQKFCNPFHPWEKPHIERVFRTFSHGLLELCPAFVGHNVAERVSIEERKSFAERLLNKKEPETIQADFMSSEDLQRFCDIWTEGFYMKEKHSSLGMSPEEKRASWTGAVRRIPADSIRGLDLLLAPAAGGNGFRNVSKKGILLGYYYYWAPELACYAGMRLPVFEDITDAGRIVVYTPEYDFICIAECPEITGVSRAALAVEAKRIQNEKVSEAKKALNSLKQQHSLTKITKNLLDSYAEAAGTLPPDAGEITDYTTSRLEAAAEAATAMEAYDFDSMPDFGAEPEICQEPERPEVIRLDNLIKAEFGKPADSEEAEKQARRARYEALARRNFAGISEADDRWRRSWETTSEYRAWRLMCESFGADANTGY